MPRRRRFAAIALAIATTLGSGIGLASAGAEEVPPGTTDSGVTESGVTGSGVTVATDPDEPPADPDTGRAPLMIVLDASGSMDLDEDGEPGSGEKMRQAKQLATQLVNSLPSDTDIGLTVYGTGTGNNTSEQRAGCADVTVLEPVGPVERETFDASLEAIEPSGYAPIGLALQQAAAEVGSSGPRNVVLISDADEFCNTPEPCASAKRLAAEGLAISTIGIDPEPDGERVLECIAEATGGRYVNADDDLDVDRDALARVLTRGYQRAAQRYSAAGTAVVGSPEIADDATALTPGSYLEGTFTRGRYWSDAGDKSGTVRYYRLPQGTGMTPWVSATIVGDRKGTGGQIGLGLTLVNADDDPCLPLVDETVSTGEWDPIPRVTAVIGGVKPAAEGWSEHCAATGAVFLRVERLGDYRSGTGLPVELLVRSEPDISSEPGPARSEENELDPPLPQEPTTLAGGSDYTSAPELAPDSTIADTIVAGETRFYRVPVGWGQRLAYRVVPTGKATPVAADTPTAAVTLRNPLRQPVAQHTDSGGGFELPDQPDDSGDPGGVTGDLAVAVDYGNRTSDQPEIAAAAFAGGYYLALSMGNSDDAVRLTVPFTLTVTVAGDAEQGPGYLPGVGSGETPPTALSSATETDPSGASTSSADGRTDAAAADSIAAGSPSFPSWIWALGGAAAALLLASLIALLAARRSRRSRRA